MISITPRVFEDRRGLFMETFNARDFAAAGLEPTFFQHNHTSSVRGTLRGLHYQVERAQGKLIQVVAGEVYDVAVDLRRGRDTFGHSVAERLSSDNRRMLWIPEGFAHGFYVTSDSAVVLYHCTAPYVPECERTIRWDDPELAVDWPLEEAGPPLLSDKDLRGVSFRDADRFP